MDILKRLADSVVVPVVVLERAEDAIPTAEAMRAGGIDAMEITFRTACAPEAIKAVAESCPDTLVGAGTVTTLSQAKLAVDMGAKFIVSPGFDEEIVAWCVENHIAVVPGCVTPGEIMAAKKHGLKVLKFFPANVYGGLNAMKNLAGPFGDIKFVPTGGVSSDNVGEFIAAPFIHAVGGSWVCPKADISAGNWDKITQLCADARKAALGRTASPTPSVPASAVTVNRRPDASEGKKSKKIVTFGELMLRLQPYNYERFVQCDHVEFTFGGGEANVAVSLANYGMDVAYVTKLPAHAIGQAAVNSLRRYGVDTSEIVRGGSRIGIYYNEKGASQRGSVCIYDRAHSAIQESAPSDFDWDKIFEGVEWFHFTGITPALGENLVETCRQACQAAKARGIKISCDLNYRGKLWTREQARIAMTDLCRYVDVCISNEEDAKDVFGIEAEATDIYGGSLNHEGYKSVAKQLADKFGFEMVAITLRESRSASENGWSAMLHKVAGEEYCFSKKYDLHIVDRVGGGDSFAGGLIYSLMNGKDTQAAVEFAVAASALKHTIEGDYNMVTIAEVEKLAGGDGSGRIQR